MSDKTPDTLLNSRTTCERLGGICAMTLHRWRERGILPAPTKINGRNYWRERDIAAVQAGDTAGSGVAHDR